MNPAIFSLKFFWLVETHSLSYKDSDICYYRFGNGPKAALCFHGYGEDALSFFFLEKFIGNEYSLYAIDLPFHGKTQWNEGPDFSVDELQKIIDGIVPQNEKLTLIGFSLGGRVALSLFQKMPLRIDKILLLAPDGLKINPWYWLATQTRLGNRFFSFTMKYPGWFFLFLRLLNNFDLANSSIFKFVKYYIDNKEVRMQLYNRWTSLRKLKPDLKQIKFFILQYKTPVRLIYGKHDRIILPVRGEKFRKGIEDYCSLKVIHSGHQVLHEKHSQEILPILLF
ncbi:MAG TPA: alpha/beta hydrolase [Chitinophagaceae bacterium]|nr:alpha/beta hydrolase [Chitinophagaceae bacterium]